MTQQQQCFASPTSTCDDNDIMMTTLKMTENTPSPSFLSQQGCWHVPLSSSPSSWWWHGYTSQQCNNNISISLHLPPFIFLVSMTITTPTPGNNWQHTLTVFLHLPHPNNDNDAQPLPLHTLGDDCSDNALTHSHSHPPPYTTTMMTMTMMPLCIPCPPWEEQKQWYNAHHHVCCAATCVALTLGPPAHTPWIYPSFPLLCCLEHKCLPFSVWFWVQILAKFHSLCIILSPNTHFPPSLYCFKCSHSLSMSFDTKHLVDTPNHCMAHKQLIAQTTKSIWASFPFLDLPHHLSSFKYTVFQNGNALLPHFLETWTTLDPGTLCDMLFASWKILQGDNKYLMEKREA